LLLDWFVTDDDSDKDDDVAKKWEFSTALEEEVDW